MLIFDELEKQWRNRSMEKQMESFLRSKKKKREGFRAQIGREAAEITEKLIATGVEG